MAPNVPAYLLAIVSERPNLVAAFCANSSTLSPMRVNVESTTFCTSSSSEPASIAAFPKSNIFFPANTAPSFPASFATDDMIPLEPPSSPFRKPPVNLRPESVPVLSAVLPIFSADFFRDSVDPLSTASPIDLPTFSAVFSTLLACSCRGSVDSPTPSLISPALFSAAMSSPALLYLQGRLTQLLFGRSLCSLPLYSYFTICPHLGHLISPLPYSIIWSTLPHLGHFCLSIAPSCHLYQCLLHRFDKGIDVFLWPCFGSTGSPL